ncbi:hypothetical protein E2C01_079712 [Portunus trituberculatus]|uniref:Uncharacterized protein n=1 Tax=Portunus trituberculatus TaxID=210409 RepID=A0A5B7IU25_PORTR|nr:hypothetical protein [Portunus trituberculatus]
MATKIRACPTSIVPSSAAAVVRSKHKKSTSGQEEGR